MADIQTLLNQTLQTDVPQTAPTSVSERVRANVAAAAETKKAALGGQPAAQEPNYYQIAAGLGNDRGAATMDPVETDLRTLTPAQVMQKYGQENGRRLLSGMAQGSREFFRDQRAPGRDVSQTVSDSLVGAGTAFVGGIAGLGALGIGLANDNAGAAVSSWINSGQDWVNENLTSDKLQTARKVNQNLTALTNRDSKAQYDADVAAGNDGIATSLRRIGRDFMTSLEIGASDGTTLLQGTAEGVGSLFSGGVVASGLRKIGTAAVGGAARNRAIAVAAEIDKASGTFSAARAARLASGATWPAAIGLQEGGSAYVGTASEIMDMPISELNKSPVFQARVAELQQQGMPLVEAQSVAKSQIAGEGGLTAAAIQTPFAAATGFLTRGLERPLSVPSLRALGMNTLVNEPTEELIQSGVGQVAQNIGIRQAANPNRDVSEGVGEASALGALYGMSSAGAIQSPAAAVIGGKRAFAGTKNLIDRAIEAGKPLVAAYTARAERIREQQAKAATVPTETMVANSTALASTADANVQAMQSAVGQLDLDPEQQVSAADFITSLGNSVLLSPTDPIRSEMPPELADIISQDTDRFQAALKMAAHTESQPEGVGRLMAAAALQVLIQPMVDLQRADSSELEALPSDSDARKIWGKYSSFLANVDNTPEIKSALQAVADIQAATVQQVADTITDESVQTPQGQLAAQAVMAVAEVNPLAVPQAAAQVVLKHAGEGRVRMTDGQRQALNTSMALLDAQQALRERAEAADATPTDVVANQVMSDRDPIGKGAKNLKLSAAQQATEILKYMRAGNIPAAAAQLADFGMFVQHMQNKVAAINTSFAPGKNRGKRVAYQALSTKGGKRSWYSSDGQSGAWVNTGNEGSVSVAKNIGLEAATLAQIYEGLRQAFPQLEAEDVTAVPMNPDLLSFSFGSGQQAPTTPAGTGTGTPGTGTGTSTDATGTPGTPTTPAAATPTFDKLPAKDPKTPTMTYAGIGSRNTPRAVLEQMTAYAKRLEGLGYTLRSGGAKGADTAFENGTQTKQIFYASDATDQTRQIAKEIHPKPDALSGYVLNLMARNTNQLFGKDLDTPVDFVLAWTPDGAETSAERTIKTGGTGQAIDMASRKGIPVFNLATADGQARFEAFLESNTKARKQKTTNPERPTSGEPAPTPTTPVSSQGNLIELLQSSEDITAAQLLAAVKEVAPERLQPLLSKLESVLNLDGITVAKENIPNRRHGATWNESSGTLTINQAKVSTDGFLGMDGNEAWATAITHELVHAATDYAIDDSVRLSISAYASRSLNEQLSDITDRLKSYARNNHLNELEQHAVQQMLRNRKELVAWGMTDSNAQRVLSRITGRDKRSLFEQFVSAIANALGISAHNTALNDLLTIGAQIIENQQAPAAPTTPTGTGTGEAQSRITPEQAARLSDEGLNARIEAIQDKRAKGEATPADDATFSVLDEEMTRREDAVIAQQGQGEEQGFEDGEDERTIPTDVLGEAAEFLDTDNVSGDLARAQIEQELAERQQPTQEQEDDTAPLETLTTSNSAPAVEPAPTTGMAMVFPALLNGARNFFYRVFSLVGGETPPTRLLTLDEGVTPFMAIRGALDTREDLVKFLGKEPKRHLSDDTANAYQKLLTVPRKAREMLTNMRPALKAVRDLEKQYLKTPSASLERELAEARAALAQHQRSLANAGGIAAHMRAQLSAFLVNKVKDNLDKGVEANRWRNGKALNIVNEDMQFDENLLESAVLAGMQWLLGSSQQESFLDDDDVEAMTGIRGGLRADLFDRLSQGFSPEQVKRMLAAKITTYWGVKDNADGDKAYTEGIPEAVAAVMVRSFLDLGLMNIDRVTLTAADGLPENQGNVKTINRFTVDLSSLDQAVFGFPMAIENTVLVNPEEVRFFGEERPTVARTQLNNPMVDNTRKQRRALSNEQETEHKLNLPMIHLFRAFGKQGMRLAFAAGEWDGRTMNKNHAVSVGGQNRNVLAAYDTMMETLAEAESYAIQNNIPLSEVTMRFAYNMTRTGRMQMLGKYNAQSNKQMREAVSPTWATLDLVNNAEHQAAFYLAMAQALGVKLDKLGVEKSIQEVRDRLNGSLAPAVDLITEWLAETEANTDGDLSNIQDEDTQFFPVSRLLSIFKDANVGFSAQGLTALVEYARYSRNSESRSNFTTAMYLEADGKTNGLANALVMLTGGQYDDHWFKNVQKIGLNIGDAKSIDQLDKVDLYAEGTKQTAIAQQNMMGQIRKQKNARFVMKNVDAVGSLMSMLFPDDVQYTVGGEVTFTRNIMKNPMTIFTYGSSARGIAGNIVGDLTHAIYTTFSRAADAMERDKKLSLADALFPDSNDPVGDTRRFISAVDTLMNSRVYTVIDQQTGELKYNVTDDTYNVPVEKQRKKRTMSDVTDLVDFTFDRAEIKNLTENVLNTFVAPMTQGIQAVVGNKLTAVLKTIRKATQIQSIYMQHAYVAEINDVLRAKREADPDRHANDFLSANDLRAIDAKMLELFPLVQTEDQAFLVAKSRALEGRNFEYATDFNDNMSTPAYVYTPANAGVSGIPYTVIGFGDGLMMQLLALNSSVKNTLKIFDGMNMPLDKIREYSEAANAAVLETWKRNPVRAIELSYEKFLSLKGQVEFTKALAEDLTRAISGNREDIPDQSTIEESVELLQGDLARSAMEIEARHRAMNELNQSVDQMTGAASPHAVTNKVTLTGTEALAFLQEAYTRHLKEIQEKQGNPRYKGHLVAPAMKPDTAFNNVGRVDPKSGARTLPWASVKKLGRLAKMSDAQRSVLDQVLEVAEAMSDNISIIYGTPEQIRNYQVERGLDGVVDPLSTDNGFITTGDKTRIYLMNPQAETLIHELVHAVTFNTIHQFYQGKLTGKDKLVVEAAIRRLEILMADFIGAETDTSAPFMVQHATDKVKEVIAEALNREGLDPATAKAIALNEFMAWSLSNPVLMKALGAKKVNPIVALANKVINAIKDLIWRGKNVPPAGDDVLSNIMFNTGVIMRTQPSLAEMSETVRMAHAGTMRPGLMAVRDALHNKVVSHLDQVMTQQGVYEHTKQMNAMALQASKVADLTRNLSMQFNLSPIESTTLHSVVTALGTEISLDPNALARVQELYVHVQKNLNISHFIDENAQDPGVESTLATQKFNLIMGKDNRYKDPHGRTTMLPAFLGLAMVSERFRSVLEGMGLPKSDKVEGKTVDARLRNLGTSLMDALSIRLSGQGNAKSVRAALDNLTHHIYQNLVDEQSQLEQIGTGVNNVYESANDHLVAGITALSRAGVKLGEKISDKATNRLTSLAGGTLKIVSALASETESAKVAEGVLAMGMRANLDSSLMAVVKDFVGRTETTAKVYDMIKIVRALVQQIRQQFREKTPLIINSKFKVAPTKAQYASMFRVLAKTDLAVLAEFTNTADAMTLLTDDAKRAEMVASLEDTVRQADPVNFKKLQSKMKQLANFMNTGVYGKNLLSNAYAISQLWGEVATAGRQMDDRTVAAIDRLTTLYSLNGVSKADRESVASLVQSEAEGISFVLDYLRGQRKDELKKVQSGVVRANHYKGHTPSLQDDKGHMVVDYESNEKDLLARGYVRVAPYNGSSLSPNQERRHYYYSKISGRAPFSQGIMQNIKMTAYGVDEGTGLTTGQTAGRITDKKLLNLMRSRLRAETGARETLRPVYDMSGRLIAVEETLDPAQMARLEYSEQLHEMLGVWRGRQVEERKAAAVNYQLVNNLFDQYTKDQRDNQGANSDLYVNLFDYKNRDAVQMDALALMPDSIKEYIESKFGKGMFLVRKDQVDDVIGYRNASVGDLWTGNNRLSSETNKAIRDALSAFLGKDAYTKLVRGEQILHGFMSDMRTLIVVKSIIVPTANFISNVFQLISRGVTPWMIARTMPTKLAEINSYVRSHLRQIDLEAELRAVGDNALAERRIRAELRSITDSHRRLSIWPLIEAGEFSTIADVGMTPEDLELSSGKVGTWMERQVDKLPDSMKTAARYGLISRDTALFQGLQRSVQYGDFLAKAVLYDHLTENKKLAKADALGRITEEFVNYERLPGRVRGGLENAGLLWFYNFKLRITKVALSTLRNNPLMALTTGLMPLPSGAGLPVDDNVIAKSLQGSLGHSIGPGMALRAPTLMPWYNFVN